MITVNKRLLSGTPDEVWATVEHLDCDQEHLEYLAGTRLRELAVKLAGSGGLTVSAVSYDDMAGYELEATLVSAPHHDPVVIGRSRTGDHCQVTLERWLPIDGEPGHRGRRERDSRHPGCQCPPRSGWDYRRDDGAVGLPSSAMSATCPASADREKSGVAGVVAARLG
jgi:hypothetical protein